MNKTDWVRHGQPAVVNAFYSPLENSIQFLAGILQVMNAFYSLLDNSVQFPAGMLQVVNVLYVFTAR